MTKVMGSPQNKLASDILSRSDDVCSKALFFLRGHFLDDCGADPDSSFGGCFWLTLNFWDSRIQGIPMIIRDRSRAQRSFLEYQSSTNPNPTRPLLCQSWFGLAVFGAKLRQSRHKNEATLLSVGQGAQEITHFLARQLQHQFAKIPARL